MFCLVFHRGRGTDLGQRETDGENSGRHWEGSWVGVGSFIELESVGPLWNGTGNMEQPADETPVFDATYPLQALLPV